MMKKRSKYASGSVTVLLSLAMSAVLIMAAALTELSRTTLIKAHIAMDCENALGSALAEYNRPLLERYNIFGLDGAYGKSSFNSKKIADRMKEYMPGLRGETGLALGYGGDISLDDFLFLTDKCGNEVYEQAVTYMKKAYGLDILAGLADAKDLTKDSDPEEDEENGREIASRELGDEASGGILSSLASIRSRSVLSKIFGSESVVSSKSVPQKELLTNRRSDLFKGAGLGSKSMTDKLLFQEYMFKAFSCYTTVSKGGSNEEKAGQAPHALDYELEHIISGKGNDKENLGDVAKKLVRIREVVNFLYLQSDSAKQGEAELLAMVFCTVTASPQAIEAVKQAILVAWAYSESICDVRTLLKGGKVPPIKSKATWKTGIMSIFNPGGTGVLNTDEGLDYETYLRALLLLKNEADKCGRAMDIMEMNIRKTEHYGAFAMDNCLYGFSMQGNFKVKHIFTPLGQSEMDFGGSISYEMLEKRK